MAAHFVEGTCDGIVSVALATLQAFPALSLTAAIDYFPQVEQVEWIEQATSAPIGLGNPQFVFDQGGPTPLSDGRFAATQSGTIKKTNSIPNLDLKDAAGAPAFPPSEAASSAVTAVVGRAASSGAQRRKSSAGLVSTWLPDAASDVFEPGWDVSQHVVDGRPTYVTYGLDGRARFLANVRVPSWDGGIFTDIASTHRRRTGLQFKTSPCTWG